MTWHLIYVTMRHITFLIMVIDWGHGLLWKELWNQSWWWIFERKQWTVREIQSDIHSHRWTCHFIKPHINHLFSLAVTFTFITKADLQTRQWSVLMNYTVLHWLFMQKQIVLRRLHIKPTQRRPKRPKKSTYVFKCTWINGMTFSSSLFLVQIYCYKKIK